MKTILQTVAENAIRLRASASQTDVGRRGGLAQKTVSNIENGENTRLLMLDGLARALSVPTFSLLIDGWFSADQAQAMGALVNDFLSCDDAGRQRVCDFARSESRYREIRD